MFLLKSRSFATVAKDQDNALPNLRKILREEKIKDREEEHQQDLRQENFIIFGVEEQKGTSDDKFIEQLLNDVKVSAKVKFVTRIGNKSNHKRPIKVVLESAHQRWLIMHSLTNLKGNTSYNGISVTGFYHI